MKVIGEHGSVVNYEDEIQGQVVKVDYNKITKQIIIKVDGDILSRNDYLIVIGKTYKVAMNDIRDFQSVSFEFYPTSEAQLEKINNAVKEYNIENKKIVNSNVKQKEEMIEKYFKANIISKNENGNIVNYAVRQADSNNSEYLLENVDMNLIKSELADMLSEGNIELENMSEAQITNMVLDKIANDRKQHVLSGGHNYEAKNEYERAGLIAAEQDDLVNTEIGVVKKNPEDADINVYRTVERSGDNYVVSSPSVSEVSSIDMNDNNPQLTQNELANSDVMKTYYVDHNTGNIYNESDELVGNLSDGYVINEENHLILNGKDLGWADDINNKTNNIKQDDVKVRKLVKPEDSDYGIINIKAFTLLMLMFASLVIIYLVMYLGR